MDISEISEDSKVHYHSIIGGEHDGKVYEIRAIGNIPSSEEPVVWLKGKSGCVSLEALSLA